MPGTSDFASNRGGPVVFISHSTADLAKAEAVRRLLSSSDVDSLMDRVAIKPGDSIVDFMESGIGTADYFLLLWSKAAAQSKWVGEEWQAALCRAVREKRAFLVVGKLHTKTTFLNKQFEYIFNRYFNFILS